jgi:hypothetical protein
MEDVDEPNHPVQQDDQMVLEAVDDADIVEPQLGTLI